MAYATVFHSLAEAEYIEAFQWYEAQLPGLGERFEQAVEEKINQVSLKPQLFPVKKGNFREAKVGTFPYVIVFWVYKSERMIFISSIFHTSRSPRKKYRKNRG